MQMFPDDLPFANIDADGYCCHFMRSSVRPWAWVCVLHTKRLEEMAYNLACWYIQMAYTQHSWMLMDIVVGPSVRLFVYGIFSKVRVGAKEGGSHYWEMAVVLPSLVDTGDICCHYWQHILVYSAVIIVLFVMAVSWYLLTPSLTLLASVYSRGTMYPPHVSFVTTPQGAMSPKNTCCMRSQSHERSWPPLLTWLKLKFGNGWLTGKWCGSSCIKLNSGFQFQFQGFQFQFHFQFRNWNWN